MTMPDFIFSNSRPHRLKRHFAFLFIIGLTFFFQSIVPGKSIYQTAFFSFCCFFPACVLSIYTCIYVLLPAFLQKKKYLEFFLGFILLATACFIINHPACRLFLQLASDFGKPGTTESEQMNLAFINTSHAMILGGLALGIKFAKNIYLQQKENSVLARQKIITDLRLEKTRIYPKLLYQSLDNLRSGISAGSADASAQLLKVSELLSYILYDNNEKWVPLEKEINMMQHLIDIGRTGQSKQADMLVDITGDSTNKYIVPMTLFPLLESCFKLLEDQNHKKAGVHLTLNIKSTELLLQLSLLNVSQNRANDWKIFFSATGTRLDALYPEACHLEIKEDPQWKYVLLRVKLKTSAPALIMSEEKFEVYELE